MSEREVIESVGAFLARTESRTFWAILELVRDNGGITTKEIVDRMRIGKAHGEHAQRLHKELRRLRETGALDFKAIPHEPAGHFHHYVSELGQALLTLAPDPSTRRVARAA